MLYDRNLNLEGLARIVDTDMKRIYSDDLIENMQNKNFNYLYNIDITLRSDMYFMNQLLFAVRNSKGTYEVYKYYGEELQKDITIVSEIVSKQPEVIENTAVSYNETIMMQLAQINPRTILYMSETLKDNENFIQSLCETGNNEVIKYAAIKCNISDAIANNPNLSNNSEFMKVVMARDAIIKDVNALKNIDENLRNNYEFIKVAAKENEEVIDYVAEHTEEFGIEAINGIKEVLIDNTTCRAIDEMQIELEKVQEEKVQIESQEGFNKESEEYKKIRIRERQLNNNIRFINQIKNGEVKQERAIRIINAVCKDKDEQYKQELLKYIKMDDAVIAKEKAEKSEVKVVPEDIERVTGEEVKVSDLQKERKAIEVTLEKTRETTGEKELE